MVFTRDSAMVKVWVSLVLAGTYTLEQVPKLSNMKDVVTDVVNETLASPK